MEEEKNGLVEESRVKSEEPGGFAEESRVKSEESSEDVIYEIPEESESSESSEDSENAEDSECLSEAETSLREMVAEMGAERVLEIIRDNRNAAISVKFPALMPPVALASAATVAACPALKDVFIIEFLN